MFTLTPDAATELLAAATRSQAAGMALRVAARQIADGTLEYGLGFDEQREDDAVVEVGGLRVLVGAPSQPLLDETVLDYVEVAPSHFDFVFAAASADSDTGTGCGSEPAAKSSGCGGGGCGSCG